MKRLLLILVAVAALAVSAVSSAPQVPTLPLAQLADFVKVGAFDVAGQGWEYRGGAAAYNPANNSLYLNSWAVTTEGVTEITIPATLSGVATVRQGPRDPFEGKKNDIGVADNRLGGQLVVNGRLITPVYAYYDANYVQTRTHFSRPLDLSVTGQVVGPVRTSTAHNAGYYAGYMAHVPQAWQAALGAVAVTGGCCIPILSRTSFGPALFAFDPATMTVTSDLVWYDGAHPLGVYGQVGVINPLFNGSTNMAGVVLIEGTSTVAFFGRTGLGPYCYGDGAECNDPENAAKGEHAYPYAPYVWLYDLRDLVAVKNGTLQPWAVRPYAHGTFPSGASGVAYDAARGLIYLSRVMGPGNPKVDVYRVQVGTVPPPPPPPDPVACVGSFSTATTTTSQCVAPGTQTVTSTRTYTVTTPASNGGAACPHPTGYVETTTTQQACSVPPPPPTATLTVTGGVYECRWVMTSTPPTSETGWGVTFSIDGAQIGTRDTSTPFTRTTSTVPVGAHHIAALWTRTGSDSVTVTESKTCQ